MQFSLLALEHAEHIAALRGAIFALSPEAHLLYEVRLGEERSKNQKQREELQRLLALPDSPPDLVH